MNARTTNDPVSLYIHVPFCPSKCAYCDFVSAAVDVSAPAPGGDDAMVTGATPRDLGDAYVDAVLAHVAGAAEEGVLDAVPTVYVGGGTPTLLGERLVRLVRGVRAVPGLAADVEFTVETNPETTSESLTHALVLAGVTRFSLGIQSFDDDVLAALGRCHDAMAAERAAAVLRDSGMPFSLDLICGVPGQSDTSWRDSVERAIATGAGHVSVYPLSIEDGTPLSRAIDAGVLPEPDSDTAAEMMETAADLLTAAGLERYEVASYARPGQASRHNSVYWTGGEYLGIGPSAASMMSTAMLRRLARPAYEAAAADATADSYADSDRVRIVWAETLGDFLGGGLAQAPAQVETLSRADALREDAMLGMRMSSGITETLAEEAGVITALESLAASGLVARVEGRWRPTRKGWLLGNEVFSAIWTGE